LIDDQVLIPGLIGHATPYVEHPELIVDGICNYASLVGRERVIAGADCGYSSRVSFAPEIPDVVVWEKFRPWPKGSEFASERLLALTARGPKRRTDRTVHTNLALGGTGSLSTPRC